MTELSDYSKFTEGPLVFPINGKKYTLPEVGIEAGAQLAGIYSGKDKSWAKKDGIELFKLVLGSLWDEMIADNVPLIAATRVALAAIADHTEGREMAIIAWETGADPKALAPYLREKAAGNRASRRSTSSATGRKTPTQASTKATGPRNT